ncbi:DNA repair protein (mre11) [Vittaforma corneae ATCC 50505]|uniref:DNA repair protein (Mre11) n=1 Tax=Vittaforma corneae (strain ATCC 50505) TaxID=993615 RepID=L2GNM6_VITCO|nr:DNA repair protein (mre11) [Vittaforma corneae ATCC 50505]ELA42498.1 DNA repair protein (mre11) [Vittaforma corneae ATCC 50505]
MKVLVTSDNHLGFKETDPIRADDTFNTFDEILFIAQRENVDLVLQGGDLFHENQPSRNTYNRTVKILKKYCLGTSKPNFKANIRINTDDPNMNISLPILSIHGNHDDPSGFNSVSPHDILHSGGFVNYFGKVDDVDDIELKPILIQGDRKVAIYGMGHIKDRRVYRTFIKDRVRYVRPEGEEWINIFIVHQNRTFRPEEYLPEDLINPFFDIVIYGHEHESIKTRHKNFEVLQCGSTVRTSLCEGEMGDKFVYIIDISERVFINRIKLETVRPFIMDTIKIFETNNASSINNNITGRSIDQQIKDKVEEILERLNENRTGSMLPLLRLRVDIDGNLDFNKHNIITSLESKIANPNEALRISRKQHKEILKHSSIVQKNEIEDVYKNILDGCDLKALVQGRVIEALLEFLNKDSKEAFSNLVKDSVKSIIDNINMNDLVADSIEDAIKNAREKISKENNAILTLDNKINSINDESKSDSELYEKYQNSELYKTIPLPQPSISFQSSSIINLNSDYTFIEDKIENIEKKEIIENAHKELEERIKKSKIEDDFDELFGFSKFMPD